MSDGVTVKIDFPRHPKTKILVDIAGQHSPWSLILLWIHAGEFYPKGLIPDKVDIEREVGWSGERGLFRRACIEAGFVKEGEAGIVLHDWKNHNGWLYFKDKRRQAARRAVEARWRKRFENQEDDAGRIRDESNEKKGAKDTTAPEKKSGKPKKEPSFILPADISEPVWNAFVEMRNKIKRPLTDYAMGLIVKKAVKFANESNATPDAILEQSIERCWQGVFALKSDIVQSPAKRPAEGASSPEEDRRKKEKKKKEFDEAVKELQVIKASGKFYMPPIPKMKKGGADG